MKAYGAAMGPEVVLSEVKYVRHIEVMLRDKADEWLGL